MNSRKKIIFSAVVVALLIGNAIGIYFIRSKVGQPSIIQTGGTATGSMTYIDKAIANITGGNLWVNLIIAALLSVSFLIWVFDQRRG